MLNSKNDFKTKELKKQLKESRKLGVKELKNYKGFENIEESEAKNVLETLYVLAELLLTINLKSDEQ